MFNLLKKSLLLLAFFYLPVSYSQILYRVSIEGNKLVASDLIRSHIQLKKGSTYTKQKVQQDVRHLFSLGFFDDIQVHRFYNKKKQLLLSYKFKERVFISTINFTGNKKLNTKDLKEMNLVKEYDFLDPDLLQKTLLAIKKQYKEKAYYLTKVHYKIKQDPKKQKFHQLVIQIKEDSKLFVQDINFIGNRNIAASTLKKYMKTKQRNLFSFLGASGVYQAENIDKDLQFIEYYYRDQGYLSVKVEQPELIVTEDKKFLSINFKVYEGARYKMGKEFFAGDELVSREDIEGLFQLSKKEYFSLGALQQDMQLIAKFYQNKGYAFVKVEPQFFPDTVEQDKINISFNVNKGQPYRVRRIVIKGNKNARDKVVLRRFQLKEGALYNQTKIDVSKQLLEQLSFFEKVDISPKPLIGNKQELDLITRIKERNNSGEANLAGGYNSQTKLFIQGGVKKENFLGLDQSIAIKISLGFYDETFILYYQNPYFLDTRWNFGFELFNLGQQNYTGASSFGITDLFANNDYRTYFSLDTGFSLSIGRQLTLFSTLFFKYRLSNQRLSENALYYIRDLPILSSVFGVFNTRQTNTNETSTSETLTSEISPSETSTSEISTSETAVFLKEDITNVNFNDIYDFSQATGLKSSLSIIWEMDKRNDRYYASRGFFTRINSEYVGLGGDFNHTKLTSDFRYYYNPVWKLVIKNRLDLGWVFSNSKKRSVPFTDLFLLGGPYNLRGFFVNSQGPKKFSQQAYKTAIDFNKQRNTESITEPRSFAMRPYGGEQKFFYSLELEIPIIEQAGLRVATFFDLGEVNKRLQFDLKDQLRANVGAGLRWRSPFGPLSLDLAFPYKPRKIYEENTWEFQFSVGSSL